MIKPKILASGRLKPEDLLVTVNKSNRKIDPVVEAQIDQLWQEKMQHAKTTNKHIYNGSLYRLNSLQYKGDKVQLELGICDFKTISCLLEIPGYFALGEPYYRNSCHTLATVKTTDNKFVMVELSGKSMNENNIDFLGGVMEANPEVKAGSDIFQCMYDELEEEAAISRNIINDIYLQLIYLNPKTSVGFYFEVILNISSIALLERFTAQGKDDDIKSLKVFSREEYIATLEEFNANKKFIATQVSL